MTVSEYIDGNEVVIRYYHLSFESLNYYDTPSSLLVHMKRISFNSQKIKTINEKRDFIINEYKKKYDKEGRITCKKRFFSDGEEYVLYHVLSSNVIEMCRITIKDNSEFKLIL